MTQFAIETTKIKGGYSFRRSDGKQFFMISVGNDGNVALYEGSSPEQPPAQPIVELDYTVSDKLAAARARLLDYN